jgi:hypothetical protein
MVMESLRIARAEAHGAPSGIRRGSRRGVVAVALAALIAAAAGPVAAKAAAARTAPRAAVARKVAAPSPKSVMPCSPPRPAFSGGTGAFHSDHFKSDYVTAPTLGAADIPNANFMNVYLWPDPNSETWNAHTGGLGAPSTTTIDNNTQTLVCSSYFDLLTQYNINPPSFSGDEITTQGCVSNALADAAAHNGVISWTGMGLFAWCIQLSNPDANTDQVNIFLSPDLKASAFLKDGKDMCSQNVGGYHGGVQGFPSWTVVATNPACNSGADKVLKVESHEMVEMISDPAGFGWKHDSGLDFNNTYANGELGDICSSVGEFSAPATGFSTPTGAPLLAAPYWSDQDAKCEPQYIMNDTIVPMFSTPPFSFPGTLVVPVNQSGGYINALELEVATGSEDLSGNSSFDVTIDTKKGNHYDTGTVNEGTQWGSNTLHAVLLDYLPGISVSDIMSITITETGETWDVAGVSLQANVAPSPPPCAGEGPSIDNPAFQRMQGGSPQDYATPVTVPAVDSNLKVTHLTLQVTTGNDDLDGGRKPNQNFDVVVHLSTGRTVFFPDVNRSAEWPNGSKSSQIDLLQMNSLPPSTVAGEISSVDILTNFPGGISGENWDITDVSVGIGIGCARATAPPTLQDITLLNLNPNNPLPDGHTGLCRETANVNGCGDNSAPPLTIPAVPPAQASDIVTDFTLTITTGQDDLRCCDAPGNNANAVIGTSGGTLTFPNVSDSLHFDNGVQFVTPLSSQVPDPGSASHLTLGQLQTLDIQTAFGGFQPDNWDIQSVRLDAVVAVGGCCGPVHHAPTSLARTARASTATRAVTSIATVATATAATAASTPGAPVLTPPLAATPVPHWVVKASPNQGSVDNRLEGVSCVTPTDCVAVGSDGSGGAKAALIETWDGSAWTIATTPSLSAPYSDLTGVSCVSASACLAVGFVAAGGSEGGSFQPLAES